MSLTQPSPELTQARDALMAHPLVGALNSAAAWRTFMEHHVFAVWDFMSLLKRLQRELTCVDVPWSPAPAPRFTRLINEIVLAEESDEDGNGGHCSHFLLYQGAMRSAGASTARIERFVSLLRSGKPAIKALQSAEVPTGVRTFVETSLDIADNGSLAEVSAAFLWGRESLVPDLFTRMVPALEGHGLPLGPLRYYFERHIELDGGSHSLLADELLQHVCGEDETAAQVAQRAAVRCLQARFALWTTIRDEILAIHNSL